MAKLASSCLTLKQIQNELREVTEWYPLGVQLGIETAKLKEFEGNYSKDPARCKLEVFQFWLSNDPDPSWRALLVALEAIGTHARLVRTLQRSYGDDIRSDPSLCVCEESSELSPLNGATPAEELVSKSKYCNVLNGTSSTENLYTKLQDEPPVAGCMLTGDDYDESDLEVETDKIMLKFGALVTRVRIALEQLGITVENLASHLETVKCFEPVHAQSRTPLLLDCIEEVRTQKKLEGAFHFILDYISWFNYLLIENIIEAFCEHNKDIQEGLDKYIAQFKEYCKNRLSKCPKNGFGFGRKRDASVIVVKVDHKWEVARVSQVAYVRDAVARVLSVKKQALYLRTVKNGCIELTFLVPKFVGDAVSSINSSEIADALRGIGVLELRCFTEQNVKSLLFEEHEGVETTQSRNFQLTQDTSCPQEVANTGSFEAYWTILDHPATSEIKSSSDSSETESNDDTGHDSNSPCDTESASNKEDEVRNRAQSQDHPKTDKYTESTIIEFEATDLRLYHYKQETQNYCTAVRLHTYSSVNVGSILPPELCTSENLMWGRIPEDQAKVLLEHYQKEN